MARALLLVGFVFLMMPLRTAAQETPTKEQVEELKGALDGLSESALEYRGYVDALRKIKITGYIQPQFRFTETLINDYPTGQAFPIGNFSGGLFPVNSKNVFQIRRGRIKINYDNTLTQFVIQFDATQTGFTTKDAYVSVIEPWSKSLGFQFGIFDRPFGYEISYSSSNRESPERSRVFQTLFPGERELGAKLFYAAPSGPLSMFRADIGLFNGSGPTANEYDNFKDLIGHLAYQIPFVEANAELDLGVSGYFGNVRNNTKFLYTSGAIPTGSSAGQPGFIVDSTQANLSAGVKRTYLGADLQFYIDIPSIGGAIIRGEFISGKQPGDRSLVPLTATTTSPSSQILTGIYQRKFVGWYINYIQNIGDHEQLVFKYDVYDPNTNVKASDFTNTNIGGSYGLSAADVKYSTLGLGFIHHWDDNVKFVFYYELIQNEKLTQITNATNSLYYYTGNQKDNVFTFRTQYKF